MGCGIHRVMCGAIARLVTQRPDNNAWVIEVARHHSTHPLFKGGLPLRVFGERIHRSHTVGFDIGLIDHIKTESVAELIKANLMRVVRAAHCIEVVLLHQLQVSFHLIERFGMPK